MAEKKKKMVNEAHVQEFSELREIS